MKRISTTALTAVSAMLLLCCSLSLSAQDIHFSQFYNAPLSLNPALTAVHAGDIGFGINYRSQWQSALVPYTTFFGAVDRKFYTKKAGDNFFGGGISFFYDAAGDAELSLLSLGFNGSYTMALDEENFLSFGVMADINQRSFQPENLSFGTQYIDGSFDPDRPTNENFANTGIYFAGVGAGINYHGQKTSTRTRLDVGAGVFHLNQPDQSYVQTDKSALPIRISLYLMPTLEVADRLDLLVAGSAQLQGPYFEALAGGHARIHLNLKKTRELALQLGANYRFNSFGDAIIPAIELHYKGWMAGFSYDINVSDFQVATNRYGGPEFSLRYLIIPVKPLENYRVCRLY